MNKPKVLTLDIETSPILAFVWGLKDQNIGLNQIKQDWMLNSWAAKWFLAPPRSIMYKDRRNQKSDRNLLIPLRHLLDEADIVITQNGVEFDSRKINARFIYHKIAPPSPYKHYDTWVLAKRVASFTSTKLEYLTDNLCSKYQKDDHSKFPGMSLWKEIENNNIEAWEENKKYNIKDVLSTEELAIRLKDWAPKAFPDWNNDKCTSCNKIKKVKVKCQECHTWSVK